MVLYAEAVKEAIGFLIIPLVHSLY